MKVTFYHEGDCVVRGARFKLNTPVKDSTDFVTFSWEKYTEVKGERTTAFHVFVENQKGRRFFSAVDLGTFQDAALESIVIDSDDDKVASGFKITEIRFACNGESITIPAENIRGYKIVKWRDIRDIAENVTEEAGGKIAMGSICKRQIQKTSATDTQFKICWEANIFVSPVILQNMLMVNGRSTLLTSR